MWEIDTLSDLRVMVQQALAVTTLEVVDFTETRFQPPVAIVVPDGMQPFEAEGEGTFTELGTWIQSINVLVLSDSKGRDHATELEDHVFECVKALNDFEILEVSPPQVVPIRNTSGTVSYWGVIIALEFITNIKEG